MEARKLAGGKAATFLGTSIVDEPANPSDMLQPLFKPSRLPRDDVRTLFLSGMHAVGLPVIQGSSLPAHSRH